MVRYRLELFKRQRCMMRLFHTYIGHIRDLELTWLAQRETGDHRTTTNGTLITLTVEFMCANVKDVIANYDGGAKHDGTLTMLRRAFGSLSYRRE